MTVFSEKLTEIRKNANETQDILGDAIGVSGKTVSKWESGTCEPSLDMVVKLAQHYSTTADALLELSSDGNIEKVILDELTKNGTAAGVFRKAFEHTVIETKMMRRALHQLSENDFQTSTSDVIPDYRNGSIERQIMHTDLGCQYAIFTDERNQNQQRMEFVREAHRFTEYERRTAMKLHENIRKYRLDNDLTQEQLADKIGVTAQAVSKWERADSLPDASMIPSIAGALGVSTDELYGYEGTSKQALCKSIFAYFHRDGVDPYKELPEIMWTALMSGLNGFPLCYSDLDYSNDSGCFHNFAELSNDCTVKFTTNPDFPYLVFAPRPEYGWNKAFEDDEKLCRKFLALSDGSTIRALRWLYQHKGYRFEFPVLLTKAGISEDEGGKVFENLRELGVFSCEDIDFDGAERKICSYFPQEEVLLVWMILRDFMYNHNSFEYLSTSIDKPMI